MRNASPFVFAAVLLFAVPTAGRAQELPIELGLDGGVIFAITDDFNGFDVDNVTIVQLPFQRFRVGFFISDRTELESSLLFQHVSSGGQSVTTLGLGGAFVYHFTADVTRPRFFVQAAGTFSWLDVSGDFVDESATQFGLGTGLGAKLPAGDRFAVRLEAAFAHLFETEDQVGSNNIGLGVGVSFFTR